MDQLAAFAAEKEAALRSASESGPSVRAFAVSWTLRDDAALTGAGIDARRILPTNNGHAVKRFVVPQTLPG